MVASEWSEVRVWELASIPPTVGQPTRALADCGYADQEVFQCLKQERPHWTFT